MNLYQQPQPKPRVKPRKDYELPTIDARTYNRRIRLAFRELGLPPETRLEVLPEEYQWHIVEFAVDLSLHSIEETGIYKNVQFPLLTLLFFQL